ncbi:hypothetical protein BDR26DRAFT_900845 [Obelidium mucronatum]|nr:hypothetical protein BDR26DRAFT_900845 [Obelidium mucronatum]
MQLKYLLIAAIALVGAVNAACTTPKLRREWSQLSQDEKAAYISAVKVITSPPESGQFKDPTIMSADYSHSLRERSLGPWCTNAEFLLFHRAMLSLYEKALASAGWTGGLIYLDEGLYANNFFDFVVSLITSSITNTI